MHGTGLTKEADCAWCAPGKYQTGVGLIAEANCTWCVAGKYQSGSGLNAALWLCLLSNKLVALIYLISCIVAQEKPVPHTSRWQRWRDRVTERDIVSYRVKQTTRQQ